MFEPARENTRTFVEPSEQQMKNGSGTARWQVPQATMALRVLPNKILPLPVCTFGICCLPLEIAMSLDSHRTPGCGSVDAIVPMAVESVITLRHDVRTKGE